MEQIRVAILDGVFKPGERLLEADLAAKFKVSRSPMREALQALESEGTLVAAAYTGALCRTLLQAYSRLAAIAADPTAINRIVATAVNYDKQRLEFYRDGKLKVPPGSENIDWNAEIAEKDALIQKLGGSMISDKELVTFGGRSEDYPAY